MAGRARGSRTEYPVTVEGYGVALFVGIVVAVASGYPVAIALGGVSLVVGYFALGPAFLQFLPSRILGTLSNYVLLAVPMFILMGLALQRTGLTERLLLAVTRAFGKLPGGLALAVLLVGTLLAASTGIVGASVVTLGLIAYPVMQRAGYSDHVSTGIIAGAGTLGQIVPPSIVLVLLGSVMQVSVRQLFTAALWPSAAIVALYAIYLVVTAIVRPKAMPRPGVHPPEGRVGTRAEDGGEVPLWLGIAGPTVLIVGVLGSILAGAASPTEASGVGACIALGLLAFVGKLSAGSVAELSREALRLTAMVYLILFGATTFALVFRGIGADAFLVEVVRDAALSPNGFVILVLAVVFVAGFFIDFIEIIFIVVPVILPVVAAYEIDPVWFAILLAVNLQTSFLTPPFGFSLFYLRGVVPERVATREVYRGVLPFVLLQLIVLSGVFIWG